MDEISKEQERTRQEELRNSEKHSREPEDILHNPKEFKQTRYRPAIRNLISEDGKLLTNDREKLEKWKRHYEQALNPNTSKVQGYKASQMRAEYEEIQEEKVLAAIEDKIVNQYKL
ncbi:hypothetical protein ILUMI_11799 [Ignelater luminosus]|uniref:Uncharacterized protein n=1 Tax=Ignelater luminosus TaxID=2038154 RepID=A0A8K0CZP2_IGNLU|nr:hypothetical protein ILUMI_11799 [Ignelater luminosus]